MSITLFFLVAVGLLAATWSLCFAGCGFPTTGLGTPATPYSNVVLGQKTIIAYWPLNDAPGSAPPPPFPPTPSGSTSLGSADDLSGNNHIGSYLVPPNYPATPVGMSAPIINAGLTLQSAVGPIIPGDTGSGDKNANPACADFEGGYVSIPWNTQTSSSPQLSTFTLEAWIAVPQTSQQYWVGGMTGTVVHVLFGAIASDGSGFVVAIDQTNSVQIIDGSGVQATGVTIDPTTSTYLAVSFDGTYSVFAQGIDDTSPKTNPSVPGAGYVPTASGTPVTFFIGAGRNDQMPRTTNGDTNGSPENPFMGVLQSVALYSPSISSTDIQSHYSAGSPG